MNNELKEIINKSIFEEENNSNCIEEFIKDDKLLEQNKETWNYYTRERGIEYYNYNKVLSVYKNKNKFIAKVEGSSNVPYNVIIEKTKEGLVYSCTCPCNFPCKHEYAVLISIDNKKYETIELKKIIKEKSLDLISLIKEIPAEELKQYLISLSKGDNIIFDKNLFNNYFRKYLPIQSYEYYYNNLYNNLVMNIDIQININKYLDAIKQYIFTEKYSESFKIIKSIIESYKDTNKLNNDEFINILPNIGMFLRVTYRKADIILKQEIKSYIDKIEKENFYNNFYLEDIIINIK